MRAGKQDCLDDNHGAAKVLLILLSLLVAGVLIPNAPMCQGIPGRDSGVFLYMGWQILRGRIPYRDVWDHKPPAIYYIDALGLFVGKGSRWGVWILEYLSLCVAMVLGFGSWWLRGEELGERSISV